jgi:hypothetical protein
MQSLGHTKDKLHAVTKHFLLLNPKAFRGVLWPPASTHLSAMDTVTIGRSYFEALLQR